jgi:hypothetical protein
MTVYSQNLTKHLSPLSGQNRGFYNAVSGDIVTSVKAISALNVYGNGVSGKDESDLNRSR